MRRMSAASLAAGLIAGVLVVFVPAGRVAACSCGVDVSTTADKVGRSDIAFVGRLAETRSLEPLDGGGSVERWPARPAEHVGPMDLVGDRLVGFGYSMELPPPGSSVSGAIAAVEPDDLWRTAVLDDGRAVVVDDPTPRSRLVNVDGSEVVLEHLRVVERATSVPDGPLADPAAVELAWPNESFQSQWITNTPTSGQGPTPPEATDPTTVAADLDREATTSDTEAATAQDLGDERTSTSVDGWLVVATALALAAAAVAGVGFGRRRSRTS